MLKRSFSITSERMSSWDWNRRFLLVLSIISGARGRGAGIVQCSFLINELASIPVCREGPRD